MANTVFESTASWAGGLKLDLQSRHHKWVVDEPEILGGTDQGPNPVELVLGGLASCLGVLVSLYAPAHEVLLKDFKVFVEGDLDLDGFQEKAPVRPGFSQIRYKIDIQSDSPSSHVDALLQHIDRICPVKDTLSGVQVLAETSLAAK
ncbi:peroxiredoxin [Leptospira kobayashii]|uniref:Peroxiredoxin n=1 Tax=Leptospira kobayashii TaxID=1917830 RepID=A0ABM7UNH5_9LEPT|nr:OsmC family protein [Leptospira kobayashii]BDA80691.1 peroxiredoxin [Leptospira kobayashii]